MTAYGIQPRNAKLDFGQVFRGTFDLIRRRWAPLLLISVLLVVLPGAIAGGVRLSLLGGATGFRAFTNPLAISLSLVIYVIGLVAQAALLHFCVSDLSGRPVSAVDSFRVGLRVFLPVLVINILVLMGITFASALLVVPGVIVGLMWCVAVPSYVNEQIGVFAVFSRSAALTKGNRWRLLGMFLLILILFWIIEIPIRLVAGLGLFQTGIDDMARAMPAIVLSSSLVGIVATPLSYAFWASLYVQLKQGHDGLGGESVGDVFD